MDKKGIHLTTFIMALSFGGVLLVSALFAVTSYFFNQQLIEHELQQSFDYRHRIIQISMAERLGRSSSRLVSLSNSKELIGAVEKNNRDDVEEALFSVLQFKETSQLDALILTGEDGVEIGNVTSPLSPVYSRREELIKHSGEAFDGWTLVQMGDKGDAPYALMLSTPVVEPELGRVIGAIHAAFVISDNVRFARELKQAAGVSELLILHKEAVLSQSSDNPLNVSIDNLMNVNGAIVHEGQYVGSKMNLTLRSNDDRSQLYVITLMMGDSVVSLTDLYSAGGVLLFVGALVSAISIAYLVRRIMGRSSERLLRYVEGVKQGQKNARYTHGSVSEFNHLGDVLGEMVSTIQENERYLTNLIEKANSPIIAWDGDGNITKFNRAAERIFGHDSDAVIGHPIRKVMGAIDLSEGSGRSVFERSLSGEVVDDWEMVQNNPKSMTDYFMSWSISPVVFNEDRSVATVLAQGLDMTRRKVAEEELHRINEELELRVMHRTRAMEEEITERRHIESELRQSEERFRDIAESTSDWFWETGVDNKFTYMSDRAYTVTGFRPEEVIGQSRMDLVADDDLLSNGANWMKHREQIKRREPFRGFEYRVTNKKGEEHVFRISGKPIYDMVTEEFKGYRGAGRDVTEDHLRALELRMAKEEAENASQAKSDFLSSMSHELRTPLNGILGFAQLMLMPNAETLSEKQKEFIGQIEKAGHHLLDLINEILDLAKIEARKVDVSLEEVAVSSVVNDAVDMLDGFAKERQIDLNNAVADKNMPGVLADVTRLKQILVNLGSNAVKYNHEGGKVTFDCCMCTDENAVEFSVIDDGPGIDKEKIASLFVPFNRLGAESSEIEGTGIGLTITRQLVELMGGRMGVESTVGEGSRFWFRVPMYDVADVQRRVLEVQHSSSGERVDMAFKEKATILYIEDNVNNRTLMEELLDRSDNIDLVSAVSAEDGLIIAKTGKADLIFLDINLPGMSGWELLKILQMNETTKHIPVVAVTAQAMPADVERGKKEGFAAYLSKPLKFEDVYKVIENFTQT